MKTIRVAAAIIEKDDRILIAKRLYGEHAGLWEFPGGKYEEGESGEETIIREIREEFDADIEVRSFLCTIEHQYDSFYLIMDCYVCTLLSDDLILHDHSAVRWIDPKEDVDWVEADRKVIHEYLKKIIN
jgi:8-oxo-dGTP diphosphatase